jgi:DNA-binding NarL/FixJ family response regulator
MTTSPLRVVIADDHLVVRRGLAALLGSLDGVEVVGEAGDGVEAVREVQLSAPDVVVMDLQMPEMDGIEATRRIRAAMPGVAVLVVTMFEDDDTVMAALEAGARGYLLKGAGQDEIRSALASVSAGNLVVGPSVAAKLVDRLNRPPAPAEPAFPELTAREREVLALAAQGHPNAVIASRLGVAGKTIGNTMSSVFAKLGVGTRAEAVAAARQAGLG